MITHLNINSILENCNMSSDKNNRISQNVDTSLSTSITNLMELERDQERQRIQTAVTDWTAGTEMSTDIGMIFFDLAKAGEGEFLLKLLDLYLAKAPNQNELDNILDKHKRISDALIEKGDGHNSIKFLL